MRARDRLAGERLDVFDRVFRSIIEELADDLYSLIVGDMDGRFVMARFAMQVL